MVGGIEQFGASATPTGPAPFGLSQSALSQAKPLVPCAGSLLAIRELREQAFPALSDPAWTMLLDCSQTRRWQATVTTLCDAAYVPYTTALRHLSTLERRGLIERRTDPDDGRRIFISITLLAREKLASFFASLQQAEAA
jgi:DNA-binding MarR family transcriptional regulator